MYAFMLPAVIPAAGEPGGPPLPNDYRYFGGMGAGGVDMRTIFINFIRDGGQLQPTMDRFQAAMNSQRKKNGDAAKP